MSRLQQLLVALTSIIVEYHAKKFEKNKALNGHDITEKFDDDGDDFVAVSIQVVEKPKPNLEKLISDITNNDKKRQTLWESLLEIIVVIDRLVMTQCLLEDKEFDDIQVQLTQFIMILQELSGRYAPETITLHRANQASVELLGFLNQLQDGYGLCTSGLLISEKLLGAFFPNNMVSQTVTDILTEHQCRLLKEENKTLRYVNEILRQQLSSANKSTSAQSTQTDLETQFIPLSSFSIFTKYIRTGIELKPVDIISESGNNGVGTAAEYEFDSSLFL